MSIHHLEDVSRFGGHSKEDLRKLLVGQSEISEELAAQVQRTLDCNVKILAAVRSLRNAPAELKADARLLDAALDSILRII